MAEDTVVDLNDDRGTIPVSMHNLLLQQKDSTFNAYATNKSYSQELLNASTFQQQIGFIIGMFVGKSEGLSTIEIIFIASVALSIVIEVVLFALMGMLARSIKEKIGKSCTATAINNVVTMLSLVSMIINFVTTALFSSIAIERNNGQTVTNTTN